MELRNDTILITGGTSGFGYQFAKQLLALGNTVIITGRNQAKLDETRKKLPAIHTFQSDVSDPAAIEALFGEVTAQFPALNILINNAGEMRRLNLNDAIGLDDINREIAINLSGPIRMIQQFLPHLKKQKTAAILNVTSGIAFVPFPLSPVYGATKSGLRSYTRSLRIQLSRTAVKVFELAAPGANTPLNDKFATDMGNSGFMEPDKVVAAAIKGMQRNQPEILPGMSKLLSIMSRLAPKLIFRQLSKVAERALFPQTITS